MSDIVERLRTERDEARQRLALAHVEIGALNAEIERLQADKAAISDTASHYLHEIELLRALLKDVHTSVEWRSPNQIMKLRIERTLEDGNTVGTGAGK